MMLMVALSCAAVLLAVAVVAVSIGRTVAANSVIYGLCATVALISLFAALKHLLGAASVALLALLFIAPLLLAIAARVRVSSAGPVIRTTGSRSAPGHDDNQRDGL